MGKDEADLVASIRAVAPDLSVDRVEAIARRIQRDLGGAYLKKESALGKAFGLGTALARGVPVAQAFADVGVSRSTGYRLLNRRWNPRS